MDTLHPYLQNVVKEINKLSVEYQQQRKPMLDIAKQYQQQCEGLGGKDKLFADCVNVMTAATGVTEQEAIDKVNAMFKPMQECPVVGVKRGPIMWFSFKTESHWRGTPPNVAVTKYARSIASTGFRQSSLIEARTLDMTEYSDEPGVVKFRLQFGDGNQRGVAAMVVWTILVDTVRNMPCGDENVVNLVNSLLQVGVNFEVHGDGSKKQALIAQAARQNQAAAVLPCSTLQWVRMLNDYTGLPIGNHVSSIAQLETALDDMVNAYNAHPDVAAYAEVAGPARKRRRGGKGAKTSQPEDRDQGLKIGKRRVIAMKNFLCGATEKGLAVSEQHIMVMGDYKLSVFSDEVLLNKSIYVKSTLPKDLLPSDVDLVGREAVTESSMAFIPAEATKQEMPVNPPLTEPQFLMLLGKMIKVHEAQCADVTDPDTKLKCKPTEEDWVNSRIIVQMWDMAIKTCAEADLSKEDFQQLQDLVLEADTLDKELLGVRSRWSKWFHMGMLPGLVNDEMAVDPDAAVKQLDAAAHEKEVSELKFFKAEVEDDWRKLDLAKQGQVTLRELQVWRRNLLRREQAMVGSTLVEALQREHFFTADVNSWDKVNAQVALHLHGLDKSNRTRRILVVIDFNAPGARDALTLSKQIVAAVSLCKSYDPANCAILAWMPSCPKEDSNLSAFEDEVTILKEMSKAGIQHNQPIRMLLAMSESSEGKSRSMPMFADGRLCVMSAEGNFWLEHSELARTSIITEKPELPSPAEMIQVSSLDADKELNTVTRIPGNAEKHQQRGKAVAVTQLRAILAPRPRGGNLSEKDDEVCVIDFQPHVGDRGLATYELYKSQEKGNLLLRHVYVGVGDKSHGKFCSFASARLAQAAAADWLEGKLKLCRDVRNAAGITVKEEVKPVTELSEPTEDQLKKCPAPWRHTGGLISWSSGLALLLAVR